METLDLEQGSPEWHKFRNNPEVYPASEAPAMMGVFPWKSRTELLTEYKTGETKPVNSATQRVFDRGHKVEELARPLVEQMIAEDLFPVVGVDQFDELTLSASFDGLTMMENIGFEHKQLNEKLPIAIQEKELPEHIKWQMDQQLFVSGAEYILFVCSDGTLTNFYSMKYYPDPERFEQLKIGWRQFKADLETFVPEEKTATVEGEKLEGLPIIQYKMDGLTLCSNLDLYQSAALALVDKSKQQIENDQDFADAAELVKSFESAETYIKKVQTDVLNEVADISAFIANIKEIGENIRQARLNTSKQIEKRKGEIKSHWITKAESELDKFLIEVNESLPFPVQKYQHANPNFKDAAKNKRTVSSLKSGLNDELANCKREIVAVKNVIILNHNYFKDAAAEYLLAFPDVKDYIYLDYDSFIHFVEKRINEFIKEKGLTVRDRIEAERAKQQTAANDTPANVPETPPMEETPPPVQTEAETPEPDNVQTEAQSEAIKQGYADPILSREQKLEEIHEDLLKVVGKVNAGKVLAAIAENEIRHVEV